MQSLFTAQDDTPEEFLKKNKRLWAFDNYENAQMWKEAKGKQDIYQILTDDYDIDRNTYSNRSGREFIVKDIKKAIKISQY
jgi:hypothetical protein